MQDGRADPVKACAPVEASSVSAQSLVFFAAIFFFAVRFGVRAFRGALDFVVRRFGDAFFFAAVFFFAATIRITSCVRDSMHTASPQVER